MSLINTKPDKVNLRLKKLSADDGHDIYDMLQSMPKDENGLVLTEALTNAGGHIGYGIAPQYRGKGYGKELLRLLLIEAKKIGLEKVLITIH